MEKEPETVANPEPRTIDELIDLPYSEMTDDEIERLIEWKVEIKAQDEQYRKQQEELTAMMAEKAAANKAAADSSMELLNRLCAAAIKRCDNDETQTI